MYMLADSEHIFLRFIPLSPNSMSEVINKLIATVETQDHHVEHELAAVEDHIKNLLGKVKEREDKSEGRIENLEALVKKVRALHACWCDVS